MCVIVYKPKNQKLPDKTILKNCWENNDDGAGYMFTKNNQVYFKKGFISFKKFYKSLIHDYKSNNLESKNLVLHFRIGTSGGINKEKTHPFIISDNEDRLNQLSGYCKSAVVHNGIFSDYVYDNKELSDTQNFIKLFLYPLLKLADFNFKNETVKKLIDKQISGSKLLILDNKDNAYLYGDFIESNGIYYSNTTYNYSYKNYYSNYSYTSNYQFKELPFNEEPVKESKQKPKAAELKKVDGWSEAIMFDDGYYLEPFEYIDSYNYYISDSGEVYEEDITNKTQSFIGKGEIIKLY